MCHIYPVYNVEQEEEEEVVVSEERNTLTGCKEGLVWESKVLFFFGSSSFLDLTKILRFFYLLSTCNDGQNPTPRCLSTTLRVRLS